MSSQPTDPEIAWQIQKRRAFAIIAHPDAGHTLFLYRQRHLLGIS